MDLNASTPNGIVMAEWREEMLKRLAAEWRVEEEPLRSSLPVADAQRTTAAAAGWCRGSRSDPVPPAAPLERSDKRGGYCSKVMPSADAPSDSRAALTSSTIGGGPQT